jgi:hypothetical protein
VRSKSHGQKNTENSFGQAAAFRQTQPVQLQIYDSTFVPVRDLEMQVGEGYKYSAGTNHCSAKSRGKHSTQQRFFRTLLHLAAHQK